MATGLYLISLCLFIIVSADVTLVPSGNVSVCASGGEISFTCVVTEGSLLWITPTGNQIFDSLQAPTSEGRFNLVVDNADTNITSTASLSNFQPEDDGLFIRCREFSTVEEAEAVLRFTGAPNVILSKLSSTSVNISWNPSDCAVQYVITVINSSDDTAYNITTTDTYTTVLLDSLPKFCVIVYRVDISNRTGPPSQQQCYVSAITPSSSNIATTPSPTDDQPSGISGGVIAGIVIAAVIVIILIAAAVLVIIIYWKKCRKRVTGPVLVYQCVCHTFYQKAAGLNSWKVLFAFVPSEADREALIKFYKKYQVYGSPFDCRLISSATIQVKVPNQPDGWTVETSDSQVDKAAIERYRGKKEPPHIRMLIKAASDKTTPPDIIVEAMLQGVLEPNIIKFEQEAVNVVECVCQVFYHKKALNQWRARVAFFPKQYLEGVNQLYQDANICSSFVVKFGGGEIMVSTGDERIPAGWKLTVTNQYQKVTTAAVEEYNGLGEPPYCEMTLRATDIAKGDLILLHPVTLIGVRDQPNNTFNIERALEVPDGTRYTPEASDESKKYVCQVFYHKLEGINHWKVTLAFFPMNRTERVRHLYQDANFGKIIQDPSSSASFEPSIERHSHGWNIQFIDLKMIRKSDVEGYNGVGKPPHCEMVFKATSDGSTTGDLKVKMKIPGLVMGSKVDIFRAAEIPCKGHSMNEESTL